LFIIFYKFIHSGYFCSASSPLPRRSRHSADTASEFHVEVPQATEGLAQSPYVAASAGFELTTLLDERRRIYKWATTCYSEWFPTFANSCEPSSLAKIFLFHLCAKLLAILIIINY